MKGQILTLSIPMAYGGREELIHPVLLRDETNKILMDCGFIGSLPLLEEQLGKQGVTLEELTGLVLTHHDHDHMGAAAALKKANPGLTVYASREEEPYISNREKPLRLRQAEELQASLPPEQQAFGEAFCEMLRRVEPVEVDVLLSSDEVLPWCGGCRILATPGHTPGHISLLIEGINTIITGDAFAMEEGRPVVANPQFALDGDKARESMEQLLSLYAETYLCYHGGVYSPC